MTPLWCVDYLFIYGMALADIRRSAGSWVGYMRQVALMLDDTRAELVVKHHQFERRSPAGVAIKDVEDVANAVVVAVQKRLKNFTGGAVQNGEAWDALEHTFMMASAGVRDVRATLDMAVATLFRDIGVLAPPVFTSDESHLTDVQLKFFQSARKLLLDKTERYFLPKAQATFITGQRATRSVISSSQASEAGW